MVKHVDQHVEFGDVHEDKGKNTNQHGLNTANVTQKVNEIVILPGVIDLRRLNCDLKAQKLSWRGSFQPRLSCNPRDIEEHPLCRFT